MTLSVGSLFSGIGGLDLGLERAGMKVVWQSENDPYACRVLAKHWPEVPNLGDITTIDWSTVPRVDLICGGFPCRDISSARTANARQGLHGRESALYWHMSDAVAALEPTWVLIENSPEWRRWVPTVRLDLLGRGYSSVSFVVPAGSVGAPHKRPRAFVVAHANSKSKPLRTLYEEMAGLSALPGDGGYWRESFTGPLRVDDGLPARMDRLRCLGNAAVPQVAQLIGTRILEAA